MVKMRSFTPSLKCPEPDEYQRLRLSYALSKEGFFDQAISQLLTVLPQKPKSIYVHLALGNLYLLQKRYQEALFHFRQLNQLDPLMALGPVKIGNTYLKQGQIHKALEQFYLALNLDPKSTSAYIGLGQTCMSQSQFEEATAYFHKALNLDPESVLVYILLANICQKQKNLEQAAHQVQIALKIQPRLLLGHTTLGGFIWSKRTMRHPKRLFKQPWISILCPSTPRWG